MTAKVIASKELGQVRKLVEENAEYFLRNGMSTIDAASPTAVLALNVHFAADALIVALSDGREISAPLEWFPRLRDSNSKQRKNWRLIAMGVGIHWEDVDENIAVSTLVRS